MVAKEPQTVIVCPLSPRLFTHERRRVQQRSADRAAAPDLFPPRFPSILLSARSAA